MAAGVKLQLKFGTMAGEKTWTFSRAKENVTTAQVKALMNAMITNGTIYQEPPLTKRSAKVIVTTEDAFDLSD